jgi:hypothetical protein
MAAFIVKPQMTRAHRVRAGIIAVAVLAGVTVCVLLTTHRSQARSLSLVFERYGSTLDFDYSVQDVAFLWFTNSSDKSYCLPMMGGTNTFQRETPIAYDSGSYMIRWEFGDQASPVPQVSFASLGLCYTVVPHSAVRIRVPLATRGEQRKVAVLCAEMPSMSPRQFWTKGVGLSILRRLPRSVRMKLLFSQPAVLRVWSDREVSPPSERLIK